MSLILLVELLIIRHDLRKTHFFKFAFWLIRLQLQILLHLHFNEVCGPPALVFGENGGGSLSYRDSLWWVESVFGDLREARLWNGAQLRICHNRRVMADDLWLRCTFPQWKLQKANCILSFNLLPLYNIRQHVFVPLNENPRISLSMDELLIPISLNPLHEGIDL